MQYSHHLVVALALASLPACMVEPEDEVVDVGAVEKAAAKVTVCHVPPGNPANAHEIVVGAAAVAAHLAHGDRVGACVAVEPVCAPGAQLACYGGPAATAGIGVCVAGVQVCNAAGSAYGACAGAVLPSAEACGDGLDNDCDGSVDEGCVGNRVWDDLDRDGLQTAGEPGHAGIALTLRDASYAPVATTVTDAAGRYYFADVAPGQYLVIVSPPSGMSLTSPDAGPDDLDSDFYFDYGDDDGNGAGWRTLLFTVAPYAAVETIDAGLVINDET